MEKIKDIEFKPGVVSSMRKNVKKAINVGIFMIAAGIIMASYSLYTNSGYELTSVYSLLVTSGAGMIAGALTAKSVQSHAEAKEAQYQVDENN